MELREIGTVARLQIQQTRLKTGEKPYRVYDTSPLLETQRVRVTPAGVVALLADDQVAIDVHHRDHPNSQNAGKNGVSIGFTANYARMRERFGAHMFDGCGGENILIEAAQPIGLDDLEHGVAIHCGEAGELWLGDVLVALPCVEFSRYALRLPRAEKNSAEMKETLHFLDGGTRGYYTTPLNHSRSIVVSVGDRVFIPAQSGT